MYVLCIVVHEQLQLNSNFFGFFQVFGKISAYYCCVENFRKFSQNKSHHLGTPKEKSNVIHTKDFCVKDVPQGLTKFQFLFIYIYLGFEIAICRQ
jgi:hypothetical protein